MILTCTTTYIFRSIGFIFGCLRQHTKVVGKADDPDKGAGEADNLDVALLGLHVCIYKEISCTTRLVLIKKTPTRKGF